MREIDQPARDWLDDRGATDASDEAAADGGFAPVEPLATETIPVWWEELAFDPAGITIREADADWDAESLARSGSAWAQLAADALDGEGGEANENNRACALVYADPTHLGAPIEVLSRIAGTSPVAAGNLALVRAHDREASG